MDYPSANYMRMREDGSSYEWFVPEGLPVKMWQRRVPFHYRVAQRQKDLYIAEYDPPQRKQLVKDRIANSEVGSREPISDPEDLPRLLLVRQDMLIGGGAQGDHPKPLIGDRLLVRKVTIRPGRVVQNANTPIAEYIVNGLIQASAIGSNVSVAARRFRIRKVAMAVVAVGSEKGEPRIRVCGRYRERTAIVPPHLVPDDCRDLQRGDKIAAYLYTPQVDSRLPEKEHYCLSPNSSFATDEPKTTSVIKFFASIRRWDASNGLGSFQEPFAGMSTLDMEWVGQYENFMLAGGARSHEQKVSEMKRATYIGFLTPVANGEVSFVTEPAEDDEFQVRTKLWRAEAIVLIAPAQGQRAGVALGLAQLTTVEANDSERTFMVQLLVEPLGGERAIAPASLLGQIIQGQVEAKVSFDEINTNFRRLCDVFRQCSIATAFKHGCPVQHALAATLGISHFLPPPELQTVKMLEDNSDLNDEQFTSVTRTLSGEPSTFTSASAGTGKTLMLARLIREIYRQRDDISCTKTLLVTAQSNNAVMNLVDAFVKCTTTVADEFLVIQSNAFLRSAAGRRDVQWENSRLLATVERLYAEHEDAMEDTERANIRDYIERSQDGMSFHVPDAKALTFALKHRCPRIIFSTVGMLHRTYGKLAPLVTGIAVDEVAVLTEQEFVTLLAMFPRTETVAFVGDPRQAKTHEFDVPDGVRGYGLFPLTDVIHARCIPTVELVKSYRFGKDYCDALVSPSCYDGRLQADVDDQKHRMFYELQLSRIKPGLPAIIFNTDAHDERTAAKSRHNEVQRNAALHVVQNIHRQQPNAQITVLTYYAAEAAEVQAALNQRGLAHVEAHTADRFQGRETEYSVVLLSRAHDEEEEFDETKFKFVMDPNRATVAITRNRQAIIVIGQVSLLRRNDVWNRFITALGPHSPILELEAIYDIFT